MLGAVAGGLQIESGRGWTSVVASVGDESQLRGLLDRFQDLTMHLVAISELGAAVMRSPAVTGGPRAADGGGPVGGWRPWLAGAVAGDPDVLTRALGPVAASIDLSGLDLRTHALVRLAALAAASQPGDPIQSAGEAAPNRGVTGAEITGVLVALLPCWAPVVSPPLRPPCWAVSEPGPQRPRAGSARASSVSRRRCLQATVLRFPQTPAATLHRPPREHRAHKPALARRS